MAKTAELKTKPTGSSVDDFLAGIADAERRADCLAVVKLMKKATRTKPAMWGSSIVGFGSHHLKYASGRELDWFAVGFSPRKGDLTLYFTTGLTAHASLLKKLGRHKTGKGCLYVKRLADAQREVDGATALRSLGAGRIPTPR